MDEAAHIEPEIAEYPEAGPLWVGLWAVARHWVGLLEQVFTPDLMAAGVRRSFALRCRNWLWSIEALVRRLIIAAARELPAPRGAPASPPPPKQRPKRARPCLHAVFAVLPSAGQARAAATQRPARPRAEHRHLGFPGDVLLRLFSRLGKSGRRASCSRHPLHRRGRVSRWDPDYRCDPVKEEARTIRYVFGPFRQYPDATQPWPEPRPRNRIDRSSPYWKPRGGSDGPEWKRIEAEWARVIPSPGLAGRIRALMRVMEKPERWIERTARRLHAEQDLFGQLCEIPPPKLRKPKLDRGSIPPLIAELAAAHAQAFPDTS